MNGSSAASSRVERAPFVVGGPRRDDLACAARELAEHRGRIEGAAPNSDFRELLPLSMESNWDSDRWSAGGHSRGIAKDVGDRRINS
jgi:hypothetical protein